MKSVPSILSRQRGTETVEFALAASLIFMLLFGIIEFSLALFDKATLANASREGARIGILYRDYWDADGDALDRDGARVQSVEDPLIEQAVLTYAQNFVVSPGGGSGLTADDITITRNLGGDGEYNVGDSIRVRIDYDFAFLVLPALLAEQLSDSISAETVMYAE